MFKYDNKSVVADYETGYLFQIDYLGDNKLRWTSLKERTDNAPMSGVETFSYVEIADDVFFINWIEEGGLVVSQIADFKNMKVTAFMTWDDENGRGHRGQLLHSGTLTFKE